MKVIRITSTAVLSLLLGVAAPAYTQQERHGQREQQEGKHEEGKPSPQHAQQQRQPEQRQQQQQRARQQQRAPQQQHAQQQERAHQQEQQHSQQQQHAQQQQQHAQQQQAQRQHQGRTQQQSGVQQSAWQQHRSQNWQSDHRTWQQRGGYHGYRIPDDRYRGYFGPDHGFRIGGLPFLVVGGYPRFQYDGYWISTVDPWPEYWGNDWYDTDDVYVNYVDNGYYLYNRSYPGPGIAINITL
jgi:hypothetical protein